MRVASRRDTNHPDPQRFSAAPPTDIHAAKVADPARQHPHAGPAALTGPPAPRAPAGQVVRKAQPAHRSVVGHETGMRIDANKEVNKEVNKDEEGSTTRGGRRM